MVEYALVYAEKYNFSIIPLHEPVEGGCSCSKGVDCNSIGKHPRIANGQYGSSTDPKQIRSWWKKWPTANIGVVTGEASGGLAVIDIDSAEGASNIKQYIPTDLEYPISETARNGVGQHWWFRSKKVLSDKIGKLKGVDFRNSGIIVLPPSVGKTGKRYKWKHALKSTPIPLLPEKYTDMLTKTQSQPTSKSECNSSLAPPSLEGAFDIKGYINSVLRILNTQYTIHNEKLIYRCPLENKGQYFVEGTRETDLFSIANDLIKCHRNVDFVADVLTRLMFTCHDVDAAFIETKVQNAIKRHGEPIEKDLMYRVKEYILSTEGSFLSADVHYYLGLSARVHKKNCSEYLSRFIKQGLIERVGNKNGVFRKIQTHLDEMDWKNAEVGNYYDLKMPLGLHDEMYIFPGNIIVVAGSPNSGKTAFVMNIVKMNMDKDIRYFNSEMGKEELKSRLLMFDDIGIDDWNAKFYNRNSGFSDVIVPDSLNIIDFLEVTTDFFLIAEEIRKIHDKLDKGVAVICLQKKIGAELGRGAEFSLEKPRLYLSIDFQELKIIKCKNSKQGLNVNGKVVKFKLLHGTTFIHSQI